MNAKSATSKAAAALAIPQADDAEMDKLVRDVEAKAAKLVNPRYATNPCDLLDADTNGVMVLFPFTPNGREEGKEYPAMVGNIDTRRVKVPVAAFLKKTDEGRQYLSLSIGAKGFDHIGGALFRQEEQDMETGKWVKTPGKELERFGLINKTIKVGANAYESAFELRVYGQLKISSAGVEYIKAKVYAERAAGAPTGNRGAF